MNKRRQLAWGKVTSAVNAVGEQDRSSNEVQKKWSCLTSAAKSKNAQQKRELNKTGGGPAISVLTATDKAILETLPFASLDGISGGIDTMDDKSEDVLSDADECLSLYKEPNKVASRETKLFRTVTIPQTASLSVYSDLKRTVSKSTKEIKSDSKGITVVCFMNSN